jgi:hypothetical protein
LIPSRCEAFQFDWDLGQQINPFPQPGLRTKEPRHAGALLFFYKPVNRFNFRLWRCFTSEFGDVLLPSLAMLKAQFGQKCPIRHPHLNSKLKAKNLL